jgi:hypothetical protein
VDGREGEMTCFDRFFYTKKLARDEVLSKPFTE